ncbi:MAG TPA: CPBP family intramembrane glutamic endopeptidase [Thermoanaerobaculia bacterium]
MTGTELALRVLGTMVLAFGAAVAFDLLTRARGLQPPGFRVPWRRALALLAVAFVFGVGVFAPIGAIGLGLQPDLTNIRAPQLFQLHFLMIAVMGVWFLLGFAVRQEPPLPDLAATFGEEPVLSAPPPPAVPLGRRFAEQLGFLAPNIPREIGLGLALGLGAWLVVLMILMAIGLALYALGGEKAMPQEAPAVVPFIAGLPILVRVLISLSAGVVEETFFRGFLQPRMGIALSTAFFALAHLSYGQPFMLVGITLLSLIYALIVRWRQSVWAAIAAHSLFDAIQLLVVVPAALRMIGQEKAAAFLLCIC